jgi:nitroimidazol reductase NimA-like FMN-containing flavoprotein (pyridoxamine 5'-phosphate oxidase superfamily)
MTLEKLSDYGLEHMTDEEVADFLDSQRVGTLGLVGEAGPYLIPMSYGYDRDEGLYFTYLHTPDSRKRALTERQETARFLVYSVESMFQWRSVSLSGTLQEVPQAQWGALEEVLDDTWRPEILSSASNGTGVAVYRFDVDERIGVRHTSLAPDIEE